MAVDAVSSTSSSQDLAYVAAARRSTDSSTTTVNFEDYITLMVAQLKNQDMYNTADTTEMTSQLAQYSLVSAAESIITGQNTNYAASLVGKQVTASYEDSAGNLVTNTGIVSGITLYEGEPLIYVNGVPYNLSEIMIVGTTAADDSSSDETENSDTETEKVSGVDDTTDTATDEVSEIADTDTETEEVSEITDSDTETEKVNGAEGSDTETENTDEDIDTETIAQVI
jgi:flagellar basal-body rod modification protein FlgD